MIKMPFFFCSQVKGVHQVLHITPNCPAFAFLLHQRLEVSVVLTGVAWLRTESTPQFLGLQLSTSCTSWLVTHNGDSTSSLPGRSDVKGLAPITDPQNVGAQVLSLLL